MSTAIEHWKAQLATLSEGERAELALFLLSTLEPDDEGAEAAWDAEASRRVGDIRSGNASGRPLAEFLADLRERTP